MTAFFPLTPVSHGTHPSISRLLQAPGDLLGVTVSDDGSCDEP